MWPTFRQFQPRLCARPVTCKNKSRQSLRDDDGGNEAKRLAAAGPEEFVPLTDQLRADPIREAAHDQADRVVSEDCRQNVAKLRAPIDRDHGQGQSISIAATLVDDELKAGRIVGVGQALHHVTQVRVDRPIARVPTDFP